MRTTKTSVGICNACGFSTARLFLLIACLATLAVWGCGSMGFSKIANIQARPDAYAGKQVRIKGTVTNVLKLPFVETKLYSVRDETGEIDVRTVGEAPVPGAQVRVRATIDTVAILGDKNIGLHLREVERW